MVNQEIKEKAKKNLHRHYGSWGIVSFFPSLLIILLTVCLFNAIHQTNEIDEIQYYNSWQENDQDKSAPYSNGEYEQGYEEGYEDGWIDGYYDEDYFEDDEGYFDGNEEQNLFSLNMLPIKNDSGTMINENSKNKPFNFLLLFLILLVVFARYLYSGMLQWLAVDLIEQSFLVPQKTICHFLKNNGKKFLKANFLITLYSFLWALLFIVPGMIKQLSYSMTNYLLKKDEELSIKEAMDLSSSLMNGYKIEYLIFLFSFFAWKLLSLLTLGITNSYVLPYFNTSKVLFFDQIIKESSYLFTFEKDEGFTDF